MGAAVAPLRCRLGSSELQSALAGLKKWGIGGGIWGAKLGVRRCEPLQRRCFQS